MTVEEQFNNLSEFCKREGLEAPSKSALANGGILITLSGIPLVGWNREKCKALFVAPPGYPGARPDCFWVEESGLRLSGGGTPQASNDSNPIPGDVVPSRSTTWFSWHLATWDPNRDSLITFASAVLARLRPAR